MSMITDTLAISISTIITATPLYCFIFGLTYSFLVVIDGSFVCCLGRRGEECCKLTN